MYGGSVSQEIPPHLTDTSIWKKHLQKGKADTKMNFILKYKLYNIWCIQIHKIDVSIFLK
jgi:hypothetical protein